MEKVIANHLVSKCVPFIQIFTPNHIGHIIAHAPEHPIEVFVLLLLLQECTFALFAFSNISNIAQAVGGRAPFVSCLLLWLYTRQTIWLDRPYG
jgi:hypothetical protein